MSTGNEGENMTDKLLEGLESTPVSAADAEEMLADNGFDVGQELVNFKARLERRIRSRTWKEEADEKIIQFGGRAPSRDWHRASEAELDAAYARLQATDYRMAARNLEDLTRDEKIAILEDMEFLDDESEEDNS